VLKSNSDSGVADFTRPRFTLPTSTKPQGRSTARFKPDSGVIQKETRNSPELDENKCNNRILSQVLRRGIFCILSRYIMPANTKPQGRSTMRFKTDSDRSLDLDENKCSKCVRCYDGRLTII